MFDPMLKIGAVLKNSDIVETFKCGNMGAMRRSKTTDTLVIITDYSKGAYHDKWIGGVLHYTGMGKSGDQDVNWSQNATLADSNRNGIDVHLFEVIDAGEYIYCGRVKLADKPYMSNQPGEDGKDRIVWIFPVRPVPDNDVRKPSMFVFADMEDYNARGKDVDSQYSKYLAEKKKRVSKAPAHTLTRPEIMPVKPKVVVEVPADIMGRKVRHKLFGYGTITSISRTIIGIDFEKSGEKKLGYEYCVKNNMLEFI